jgi:hypothetical protein
VGGELPGGVRAPGAGPAEQVLNRVGGHRLAHHCGRRRRADAEQPPSPTLAPVRSPSSSRPAGATDHRAAGRDRRRVGVSPAHDEEKPRSQQIHCGRCDPDPWQPEPGTRSGSRDRAHHRRDRRRPGPQSAFRVRSYRPQPRRVGPPRAHLALGNDPQARGFRRRHRNSRARGPHTGHRGG